MFGEEVLPNCQWNNWMFLLLNRSALLYAITEKKIFTSFVDLIPVVHTCADDLFNAIRDCLGEINLNLVDCVRYARDGASVMLGEHESVWTRIVAFAPHYIKMTCICHSLSLCVQHAFEKLPSSLGFLLVEIPKWFSKSTIRQEAYKTLFTTWWIPMKTKTHRSTNIP